MIVSRNLYDHTLVELGLGEYRPALDLLRLCRNTLHTNGYHNAKNETITYNSKEYHFIRGQMPQYFEWSFLAVLLYDIRVMLLKIVKTQPFANADRIDDPFITPERPTE
jgi:hypothetical protein